MHNNLLNSHIMNTEIHIYSIYQLYQWIFQDILRCNSNCKELINSLSDNMKCNYLLLLSMKDKLSCMVNKFLDRYQKNLDYNLFNRDQNFHLLARSNYTLVHMLNICQHHHLVQHLNMMHMKHHIVSKLVVPFHLRSTRLDNYLNMNFTNCTSAKISFYQANIKYNNLSYFHIINKTKNILTSVKNKVNQPSIIKLDHYKY